MGRVGDLIFAMVLLWFSLAKRWRRGGEEEWMSGGVGEWRISGVEDWWRIPVDRALNFYGDTLLPP